MLKKPNPDDVRKLHAEVNQIVNQRFLLTTLAITIFGVLCAMMVQIERPTGGGDPFSFAATILLSVLLAVICWWSHLLKNTMRIFTTYLAETGLSGWESDWAQFRRAGPYFAYTKPQALIFLILNPLGFLFALGTASAHALLGHIGDLGLGALGVLVVTELFMIWIAFPDRSLKGLRITEKEIAARWKALNDSSN